MLNGLSVDPQSDRQAALESAKRAYSIAPADPFVLKMCGAAWAYFGKSKKSIGALRQAVDIAPFDFGAWGFMGWPLVAKGSQRDIDELHEIMERILEATPLHPGAPYWQYHRSVACTCEGRNELAVELARQSVGKNPGFPWAWMQFANALGVADSANEAMEAYDRCIEISPELTADFYESMIRGMSASRETAELRLAGLRSVNILSEKQAT